MYLAAARASFDLCGIHDVITCCHESDEPLLHLGVSAVKMSRRHDLVEDGFSASALANNSEWAGVKHARRAFEEPARMSETFG